MKYARIGLALVSIVISFAAVPANAVEQLLGREPVSEKPSAGGRDVRGYRSPKARTSLEASLWRLQEKRAYSDAERLRKVFAQSLPLALNRTVSAASGSPL